MTVHVPPAQNPFGSLPANGPAPRLALRHLAWDSAFFETRMGSIDLVSSDQSIDRTLSPLIADELEALLSRARAEQMAHVIFRVPTAQLPLAWAAESVGMRLVDVGIELACSIGSWSDAGPSRRPVRLALPTDVPRLQAIASDAFQFGRFTVDPFFSVEQGAAFYEHWITSLCDGQATAVLVSEIDGEPAGFIACTLQADRGRIALLATATEHRRKGLGHALVDSSLDWFARAGTRVVDVKTQAANSNGLALYERAGFVLNRTELTFSIDLTGPRQERP